MKETNKTKPGLNCDDTVCEDDFESNPREVRAFFLQCGKAKISKLLTEYNVVGDDATAIFEAIDRFFVQSTIHHFHALLRNEYCTKLTADDLVTKLTLYLRYRLGGKPKNITGNERREMQIMFREGWTISTLARMFERSKSSVHAVVHSKT